MHERTCSVTLIATDWKFMQNSENVLCPAIIVSPAFTKWITVALAYIITLSY